MPIKLKTGNIIIVIISVLMAGMVMLNVLIIGQNKASASRSAPEPKSLTTASSTPQKAKKASLQDETPEATEADKLLAEEIMEDVEATDEEPTNYYNGMDPEDQPRAFMVQDFGGIDPYAAGFVVVGDGLVVTEEGWTMAPPKEGEETRPRSVMLESTVQALGFPSNSITPLWKEDSPVGTEVLIEVAASPDGENWTSWYPTTGAHMDGDISPTYPDGRPNPNYGFMLGDTAFFGVGLYQFYKYSVTLYTETEQSPTISGFRLYYQDSTMGDGYLVEYRSDVQPEDLY